MEVTTIQGLGDVYVKWLRRLELEAPGHPIFRGFSVWDQSILLNGTALESFILRILRFSKSKTHFLLYNDEEGRVAFLSNVDADKPVTSFFEFLKPVLERVEHLEPTPEEDAMLLSLVFSYKGTYTLNRLNLPFGILLEHLCYSLT